MNTFFIKQQKFSSDYDLTVHSEFMMGKENPIIRLNSTSLLCIEQIPTKKGITTSVQMIDYNIDTDYSSFNTFLNQSNLLTKISNKIVFARDVKGWILGIENEKELKEEWLKWKAAHLQDFVSSAKKQEKFMQNYEKGLDNIVPVFQQNLQ